MNALARIKRQPTYGELESIYNDLKIAAAVIKKDYGTLYDTRPFLDLVFTASMIAGKHIK